MLRLRKFLCYLKLAQNLVLKKFAVIACHPETQIARLMNRMNCDRQYALAWINNQMPLKDKIARANRVIYTDGSEESVNELVEIALCEDLII